MAQARAAEPVIGTVTINLPTSLRSARPTGASTSSGPHWKEIPQLASDGNFRDANSCKLRFLVDQASFIAQFASDVCTDAFYKNLKGSSDRTSQFKSHYCLTMNRCPAGVSFTSSKTDASVQATTTVHESDYKSKYEYVNYSDANFDQAGSSSGISLSLSLTLGWESGTVTEQCINPGANESGLANLGDKVISEMISLSCGKYKQ
jgi:hypothetical protein